MKTLIVRKHSGLIKSLVSTLGIAIAMSVSSASAAETGQVGLRLGNKTFGDGKSLKVDSGSETIFASETYDYAIEAKCKGEPGTFAGEFCPPKTSLAKLIEKISPGGSKFLKGTYDNSATGTLPTPIFQKTFAGVKKIKGVGKVDLSVTLIGKVLANGQCVMEVKNVKFRTLAGDPLGTITFMKGSKVTFYAKPAITFHNPGKAVNENAGTVQVPVYRDGNFRGAFSVDFATADGTATSSNYVPANGTIEFADGEVRKFINVAIIDDLADNPNRSFTINLSNPSDGSFVGDIPSILVTIKDND